MAGLLAGFAFTALILVLTAVSTRTETSAEHGQSDFALAASGLVAAFLGLTLVAVDYAVQSGEPAQSGRAASEEVIIGSGFAASGILLLHAVILLIEAVRNSSKNVQAEKRLGDLVRRLRRIIAIVVCPLTVVFISAGVTDYQKVVPASTWIEWVAVACAVVLIGVGGIFWRGRLAAAEQAPSNEASFVTDFAFRILAGVLLATLGVGTLQTFAHTCSAAPQSVIVATILCASLLFAYASWHFAVDKALTLRDVRAVVDQGLRRRLSSTS